MVTFTSTNSNGNCERADRPVTALYMSDGAYTLVLLASDVGEYDQYKETGEKRHDAKTDKAEIAG